MKRDDDDEKYGHDDDYNEHSWAKCDWILASALLTAKLLLKNTKIHTCYIHISLFALKILQHHYPETFYLKNQW